LSDLANNCEYLTSEKLCLEVFNSEKAKASRQIRCRNDEKMTCCYLCMFVLDCATPCRFLGNPENDSLPILRENTETENTIIEDSKIEKDKTKNVLVPRCSLCNIEMSQTRTKFRIDGWEEAHNKLAHDNSGKLGEELRVVVYLCPKCGKIELKADKK